MSRALLCLALALCACQSLVPPDQGATLRARERLILGEATALARSVADDRRGASATVAMQATEIAAVQRENAALLVTVRAGDAPARRLITGIGEMPPLTPGRSRFAKTGISRFVNAADGCVVSPQISFADDAEILYATLRAWNVPAGLRLSVQWRREGVPLHSEHYIVPGAGSGNCFWFSLTPDLADFTPGNWDVQLYADGLPLEAPQAFTIREAGMRMDG